jgi:hypothetical protein
MGVEHSEMDQVTIRKDDLRESWGGRHTAAGPRSELLAVSDARLARCPLDHVHRLGPRDVVGR